MAAGGKPIDSRNTLGHGLLPHPLPPSPPPPASGFYLLDTHQSRISAWSGLRMKLMWGRASRVWEARTLRTPTSVSGLIARVYRTLRSVDAKKATQEAVVFDIFVRTTRRESSLYALWYERKSRGYRGDRFKHIFHYILVSQTISIFFLRIENVSFSLIDIFNYGKFLISKYFL